nr:collagen-like protein [Corynebacterium lactis]
MLTAVLSSIEAAEKMLHQTATATLNSSLVRPSLAAYSPVPSLQALANDHSRAIIGSTGSSVSVGQSLREQLKWASTNLADFKRVLNNHESEVSQVLRNFDPENGKGKTVASLSSPTALFNRRPPFVAGSLEFASVAVTAEASFDASTLLGMFTATNDAAVGDAIAYWSSYSAAMNMLANDLAAVSSNLLASNHGEVFNAANASLNGLAARASSIAASSQVITGHLQALPAIKAMAVSALTAIEAESKALPDPRAQEAFERAEIAAFLAGPYSAQLQTAIPRLPNLVSADAGGGSTSMASTGIDVSGTSGATQEGLTPSGMSGAMQTASAPATASSAMPDSPATNFNTSPSAAQSAPATGSTVPSSLQPTSQNGAGAGTAYPGAAAQMPTSAGKTGSNTSPASRGHGLGGGVTAPQRTALQRTALSGPSSGHFSHGPMQSTQRVGNANNAQQRFSAFGAPGQFAAPGALGAPGQAGMAGSARGNFAPGSSSAFGRGSFGATGTPGTPGALGNPHAAPVTSHHHTAATRNKSNLAEAFASRGSNGQKLGEASKRRVTNVANIKDNDASAFEQNEYQRELFGDAPATVPAVIGENVRS